MKLIAVLLVLALIYAAACWLRPYTKCHVCSGRGTVRIPIVRIHRPCRWCERSGARLRLGRRAWNYFAAARSGASR